jgi:Uncharacterized protein conserved in bacteria
MSGLVDLEQSLAALDPRVEGTYVYHCVESIPSDVTVFAQIHEPEGITLILTLEEAREAGLPASQAFVRISLGAYTSLSAVGITATIAQTLASRDIPCNVIAGFHHDHLFVPSSKAAEAMRLLSDLSVQAAGWLRGHDNIE